VSIIINCQITSHRKDSKNKTDTTRTQFRYVQKMS